MAKEQTINWQVYPSHLRPSEPPDDYEAICAVTGKRFKEPEAGMEIAETLAGPLWMGLWEGAEIKFKDGWALIPQSFKKYSQLNGMPEEFFED